MVLAASLGNLLAGLLAGQFKADTVEQWLGLFPKIAITPVVAGILLILLAKSIKCWMIGIN